MMMTEREICQNYKEAKNKKEQIKILSDLNACSRFDIEDVLAKNGLIELEPKIPSIMLTPAPAVKPKIPDEVKEVLTNQLIELTEQAEAINKKIVALNKFLEGGC